MGQPAAKSPDQGVGKIEDAFADGAGVHHVGGENEHRHGDQHEAAEEAVQDLLGREAQVLAGGAEVGDACGDHRQSDRAAKQHDAREHAEHQPQREAHFAVGASRRARRAMPARQRRTTITANARNTLYTTPSGQPSTGVPSRSMNQR